MTNPQRRHFNDDDLRPSRKTPQSPQSVVDSLRHILRRNQDLVRNAGSLAATTGITSGLGFAYWIYAGHFFTPVMVGYGSASISTMTLLGTVGMFGIGTTLVGELPKAQPRGPLMMAGIITSFIGALLLGIGFTLVSLAFGTKFTEVNGSPLRAMIFIIGVALTGSTLVFDEATIGLLRGGLQLSRNVFVSIAKMVALPASALIMHDLFGLGIMMSWVIGTLISLIPVAIMIKRSGSKVFYRPDWRQFWRLRKLAMAHNTLNLVIATPGKLIPVLVTLVVPPQANGAYYITTMLSSFLFMVPMHLSTVLFAIASATPEKIGEKLRFVLRTSYFIGIPAGLLLGISSHFLLGLFNPAYVGLATVPLWLQIVGYVPGTPNVVYIAVCRATGRVNQAAAFLSVFAAFQMGALVVGGRIAGLNGLSIGMLSISVVESFITAPSVLRTAFGHSPDKYALDGPKPVTQQRREAIQATGMRERQEAGIVALMALATAVSPPKPQPGTAPHRARPWPAETSPQATIDRGRHRRSQGSPAVAAAATQQRLAETTSWQAADDATFQSRQDAGMAALIAIATHAARF